MSSKIKSNYESLLNQLENLFRLHGECMFLACSNTVLTSRNLLNMVKYRGKKFILNLHEFT
jgi:hypothetical protein